MDLIQARTERAQAAATHALEGQLSRRLQDLQQRMLTAVADLEAHIDFPDEDIAPASFAHLQTELAGVGAGLSQLLATSREGLLLREGLSVTIVGRPNAGKSSLLNALLGRDRAIVSPVPGTTRDVIEESLSIGGIPIRLADTAGVRSVRARVEALGVTNTHKQLATSDICIHVLDRSRPFAVVDRELASRYASLATIQVLHKCDRPARLRLPEDFPAAPRVETSSVTGAGLDRLRQAIERLALADQGGQCHEQIAINTRQADVLRRAKVHLEAAAAKLATGQLPELTAQDARLALTAIGEVLGKTTPEEILDTIFSRFCIGK
jgi:tRNA modification GTPase